MKTRRGKPTGERLAKPPPPAPEGASVLEQSLREARRERDEALTALARERELTNALRLQLRGGQSFEVPRYPAGTGLGPAPLRYQLVDSLNSSAKRALGPVHGAAKKLLSRRRGRR